MGILQGTTLFLSIRGGQYRFASNQTREFTAMSILNTILEILSSITAVTQLLNVLLDILRVFGVNV